MSVEERDPHTGYLTTGHEWNGITELNTPVPRAVYFFLIVTVAFSLVYWVLMPAWPLGRTYTKGLLDADQRRDVLASLEQAAQDRSVWASRIDKESFAQIQADARLMDVVRQTAPALFGDNCAACHGRDARGRKGFPDLTSHWTLWGGSPDAIFETIRVGVNSSNPQSRSSQMPAWGLDKMLPPADIDKVVAYVVSLGQPAPAGAAAADLAAGEKIFAANCAACHGDKAQGNPEMGAPTLQPHAWLYGGDARSIHESVWNGRQGHMPTWEGRLSLVDRKILTLYLLELRKGGS